jgi:DNA-binding transcriptional MerR regulator
MEVSDKMRIGELAELAGITTRTIRYYEELGLLGPCQREGKGFRYYTEEKLKRLRKIEALKNLGLTLDEITQVIDLYISDATVLEGRQKVIEMLQARLKETQEKISNLQWFETELKESIARVQQCIAENKPA